MTLILWGFFMMLAGVAFGWLIDRQDQRHNKSRRARLAEDYVDQLEKRR